nr:hypothetical protein [Butyricicoccus sp. OF13-6]
MRMRKKKNLDVRFAACADVMAFEPKEKRGKWRALFGNDNPIHLEIGCGKGRFAIGMAEQHPDVNFIAVEREEGALIMQPSAASSSRCPIFGLYPSTQPSCARCSRPVRWTAFT